MRRWAIRLGIVLLALLVASQFAIPPLVARHVRQQLTTGGGTAHVHVSAFPALRLLFGDGQTLRISASRLSVDLDQNRQDVFKRLDGFAHVDVAISDSRAGPFTIGAFRLQRESAHSYALGLSGDAVAGDVARYAGARVAGAFGQALADLAASAIGGFQRPVPFTATMQIQTGAGNPTATDVNGDVAGFPAGPLAQVVANAFLAGL